MAPSTEHGGTPVSRSVAAVVYVDTAAVAERVE